MKLQSFQKDKLLIITQTNHGINQAFTAFDFGYLGYGDKGLYGPADMSPKRMWGKGYNGGVEYWIDGCSNVYVQIVHFTPKDSRTVAKGEKFGVIPGDHVHVSLNVQGKWQVYLDYVDRSTILYFWSYGQKHTKWTNWATYTDREITCYDSLMTTLNPAWKCRSLNTMDMNVRSEPNTSATIVRKLSPNSAFDCPKVTEGQKVEQNGRSTTTWFWVGDGWISGCWADPVYENCDAYKDQVKVLTIENAVKSETIDKATVKTTELLDILK